MMTELKGTEKQVRWAEEIREQKLSLIHISAA